MQWYESRRLRRRLDESTRFIANRYLVKFATRHQVEKGQYSDHSPRGLGGFCDFNRGFIWVLPNYLKYLYEAKINSIPYDKRRGLSAPNGKEEYQFVRYILSHERLHERLSSGRPLRNEMEWSLYQTLEDERIERAGSRRWARCARIMHEGAELCLKYLPPFEGSPENWGDFVSFFKKYAYHLRTGIPIDFPHETVQEWFVKVADLVLKAWEAKSSAEVVDYVREIMERLNAPKTLSQPPCVQLILVRGVGEDRHQNMNPESKDSQIMYVDIDEDDLEKSLDEAQKKIKGLQKEAEGEGQDQQQGKGKGGKDKDDKDSDDGEDGDSKDGQPKDAKGGQKPRPILKILGDINDLLKGSREKDPEQADKSEDKMSNPMGYSPPSKQIDDEIIPRPYMDEFNEQEEVINSMTRILQPPHIEPLEDEPSGVTGKLLMKQYRRDPEKPFIKESPDLGRPTSMDIEILVDRSGSMSGGWHYGNDDAPHDRGSKIHSAGVGAMSIFAAVRENELINVSLYLMPGGLKVADKSITDEDELYSRIMGMPADTGTEFGKVLEQSVSRLIQSDAGAKVIIMICDGQTGGYDVQKVKAQCSRAGNSGVLVFGLGLSLSSYEVEAVADMVGKEHFVSAKTSDLAEKMEGMVSVIWERVQKGSSW